MVTRPLPGVSAERNGRRILASAKVLVAEHGVDVSLDDIARHAGVGVGTVYRLFPDREVLIDELLEDKVGEKIEASGAVAAMAFLGTRGIGQHCLRRRPDQGAARTS